MLVFVKSYVAGSAVMNRYCWLLIFYMDIFLTRRKHSCYGSK